jgi:hypothetical protein
LPPGRLVIVDPLFASGRRVTDPVLWVSDQVVPDAGRLWARLRSAHPDTKYDPTGNLKGIADASPAAAIASYAMTYDQATCACRESRPRLWPAELLSQPSSRNDHRSCACGSFSS